IHPPPEISTLSLHDALPISRRPARLLSAPEGAHTAEQREGQQQIGVRAAHHEALDVAETRLEGRRVRSLRVVGVGKEVAVVVDLDRKSTRLNSSHVKISYAV